MSKLAEIHDLVCSLNEKEHATLRSAFQGSIKLTKSKPRLMVTRVALKSYPDWKGDAVGLTPEHFDIENYDLLPDWMKKYNVYINFEVKSGAISIPFSRVIVGGVKIFGPEDWVILTDSGIPFDVVHDLDVDYTRLQDTPINNI